LLWLVMVIVIARIAEQSKAERNRNLKLFKIMMRTPPFTFGEEPTYS